MRAALAALLARHASADELVLPTTAAAAPMGAAANQGPA